MEVNTPFSTADMYGELHPGGGPHVNIWALNKPDGDGIDQEMIEMTTDLQKKLGSAKLTAKVCESQGGSVSGAGFGLNFGHSLYLTGHSQFQRMGRYLPIQERQLGGYEVDDVVGELARAVYMSDIQSIEIWCCETGCTRSALDPNQDGKVHLRRFGAMRGQSVAQGVATGAWSEVSTLDYICLGLAQKLATWDHHGNLQVTAVNGVGLVEPDQPYIRTFDQTSMYSSVKELGEQEKIVKRLKARSKEMKGNLGTQEKKELERAEAQVQRLGGALEDHVSRRDCHFVTNFIDLHSIKLAAPAWLNTSKQPPVEWALYGK